MATRAASRGHALRRPHWTTPPGSLLTRTSHLFLDAAVTDACSATALRAGSDRLDGKRAAELRAERKTKKYGPICDAIGSIFKAGVAERHGACCEDYTPSRPARARPTSRRWSCSRR